MTRLGKIEGRINRNPDNLHGVKCGSGFVYPISDLVKISFCPTANNQSVYAVRVYSSDFKTQYHYRRYDAGEQTWSRMASIIEHWEAWAIDKGLKKDYKYDRESAKEAI